MRSENCRKVCENTPWPWSRLMMAGSKVSDGEASASTFCEMPCSIASFLNVVSQVSKLPVLWQVAARAGPAMVAVKTAAANFNAAKRIVHISQ